MGAVFVAGWMIVIFAVGMAIFIPALIGFIMTVAYKELRFRKALKVVSIVFLVVGILISAIPVGSIGYVFVQGLTSPENFKKTDVVIEEKGFPTETFTANGVVYCNLHVYVDYANCKKLATPVFTYYGKGIRYFSDSGNLYRLKIGSRFDLIWDGETSLYCPEEEMEAALDYYTNGAKLWCYTYNGEEYPLNESTLITEYKATYVPEKTVMLIDADIEKVGIYCYSSDELICFEHYEFVIFDGKVYDEWRLSHVDESGVLYYEARPLPNDFCKLLFEQIPIAAQS